MSKTTFLVPDYYPRFRCKGPDCRRPCCGGWPISISMEEYFRLLSVECSPALRRRLDSAFRLADSPDADRYAQICPNYVGDCPMHLGNGLCGLQCDCGEEALPAVCRLFPRAIYTFGRRTCVCSAACELTVELLTESDAPLEVQQQTLTLKGPDNEHRIEYTAEREEVSRFCFHTIKDRSRPLARRIDRIAAYLYQQSGRAITEEAPALSEQILFDLQRALATHYATHSESVGESCKYALSVLSDTARYAEGVAALEARFPSLWCWLEKILSNYMLKECFPYGVAEREIRYEGLTLCAVYAFVLFLLAGCQPRDKQGFTDLVAAAFRLIGHTAFDHNALVLIKRSFPLLFEE